MNRRNLLRGLAGVAAGGVTAFARANVEHGVTETSVTVGQSAVMSGISKALGIEMNQGMRACFAAINRAGGIYGRAIQLVDKDDGYDPVRAAANTRELIRQGVFALCGYVGTPTSLAALEEVNQASVPFLGAFTGSNRLRSPFNRNVFNIRAGYDQEAVEIVNQLMSFSDTTRVGLFVQNDSYGDAVAEAVKRALEARGGHAPVVVAKVERNSTDVAAAVDALARAGVQGVALGSVYGTCAPLQQGLHARGVYPMLASVSFIGTSSVLELGQAATGIAIAQVMPYPLSGTTALTREYSKAMSDSGFSKLSYGSIEGYVAARVFAAGLKHAGPNPTREKFVAALETHGPFDLGGFALEFSPTNHNGSRWTDLTVIADGGRLLR